MLLYSHPQCLEHAMQPQHPERPERLSHLLRHFEATGMMADLEVRQADAADINDIRRVHRTDYLSFLHDLAPTEGLQQVDPDTALGPASLDAARYATGAVLDATRSVLRGDAQRAFCAVRPPGHHAESDASMGFCFYNSVAVAAAWALEQGLERVAILDFDVHHGNGTVEIFQDDPRVLVCSSFQHPFYPNRYDDLRREHIVLTPLTAGTNGAGFRRAIERSWFDAIQQHAPQLILVSAGFDAHRLDPLGGLELGEDDFAWVTAEICALADSTANGRVVSALEGGYDLSALASSAHAHVAALA